MEKAYSRTIFENAPSKKTPLDEGNLNKIDWGLDEIDNRVITLDTNKVDKDSIQNYIKDWSLDEETGVITITYVNDTTQSFDLNIEKIPVSFVLSEDGILTMTTADGTTFTANIGSMIKTYTFSNTNTINVIESENNHFSFDVIDGSITESKLQPNYLADVKVEVANAQASSSSASSYANDSSLNAQLSQSYAVGTGGVIRENDDTDNAKYYYQQAKNIVGGDYVSHSEIGVSVASLDANGKVPTTQLPDDLGTSDYDDLENKPSINGVTLTGNKTTADLGIEGEGIKTFDSKQAYETAKSNGEIEDGEICAYPDEDEGGGSSIVVDDELSTTSENPVQNKVITNYLNELDASKLSVSDEVATALELADTDKNVDKAILKVASGSGGATYKVLIDSDVDISLPKNVFVSMDIPEDIKDYDEIILTTYAEMNTSATSTTYFYLGLCENTSYMKGAYCKNLAIAGQEEGLGTTTIRILNNIGKSATLLYCTSQQNSGLLVTYAEFDKFFNDDKKIYFKSTSVDTYNLKVKKVKLMGVKYNEN